MQQNEIQKLYERRGKFYHNLFVDFLGLGKRFEKFFLKSNYLKSGIKVLDAGCGSGALLIAPYEVAHKRSFKNITYHGFDLTQAMLDHFNTLNRTRGIRDIELRKADVLHIDQLSREWRNYDIIISNGMLEYIPESEFVQALKNLKFLLRDNGALLIFATRKNIVTSLLIGWWWKANIFTANEIRIALQNAGFSKININDFGPMNNMLFVEAKSNQ